MEKGLPNLKRLLEQENEAKHRIAASRRRKRGGKGDIFFSANKEKENSYGKTMKKDVSAHASVFAREGSLSREGSQNSSQKSSPIQLGIAQLKRARDRQVQEVEATSTPATPAHVPQSFFDEDDW